MLPSGVGSWPYSQTLGKAGNWKGLKAKNALAYLVQCRVQVLHTGVGSWPCSQTLGKAGNYKGLQAKNALAYLGQ